MIRLQLSPSHHVFEHRVYSHRNHLAAGVGIFILVQLYLSVNVVRPRFTLLCWPERDTITRGTALGPFEEIAVA